MAYPLEVGGVDDYPVKVGSMLLTLVDPNKGYEKAFNRWYERDHYYEGCMVGPWQMAGSRWVAPRRLKDLRWPAGDTAIAEPDRRRLLRRHLLGRSTATTTTGTTGPPRRSPGSTRTAGASPSAPTPTPCSTTTSRSAYRDDDPVPVDLALDHCYDGIVLVWFDAREGNAYELHDAPGRRASPGAGGRLVDRDRLVVDAQPPARRRTSRWTWAPPPEDPSGCARSCSSPATPPRPSTGLKAYTDAVAADGLADLHLVAPFFRTVVGTDTYADELW